VIIDSHRHLVGSGWTRGGYVLSLAKMFGNLWNRVHRANKTTDEFIQDVMQPSSILKAIESWRRWTGQVSTRRSSLPWIGDWRQENLRSGSGSRIAPMPTLP